MFPGAYLYENSGLTAYILQKCGINFDSLFFWDVFERGVVIKNHLLCSYSGVSGFEFLGAVHGSNLSVFLPYASLNCTIILCLRL